MPWRSKRFFILSFIAAVALNVSAQEQQQDGAYIRSHYTKFEYRIPMRDGVRLFTSVYVPKDKSQKYPHRRAARGRADHRHAFRIDNRHRLGLDRESDRRLPR
jgi:hypothetical protein